MNMSLQFSPTDTHFFEELQQLIKGQSHDPHRLLGLHSLPAGDALIRLWRPGASEIYLELFGEMVQAAKVHDAGVFEYHAPNPLMVNDYRVYHRNGLLAHDPYGFLPTFGELDQYLFAKGVHYQLHRVMGARLAVQQGIAGVKFTVWAPAARSIALVGDFNYWDGRVNPMRSLGSSGVWELFVPGLKAGEKYKFEIRSHTGEVCLKSDPYALSQELRPATASVVADIDRFHWKDQEWVTNRMNRKDQPGPMNIYEVHLGSWKLKNGTLPNYKDIAIELAAYCKEMGFTHLELLPVQEHPLDESWGYQVSGFYAVTSRYGTPEDFQWFVNHMHKNEIGVILDWVPGHFPTDNFSLGRFDGTCIYEHEDTRQGLHPHWGTFIFNFGRYEVSNFLIANALFWFDSMHVDCLRVDAVASMLYLDYGREAGEWIPNQYGNNMNLEAIQFFKHLNSIVHQHFPGVLMIAEESTAFTGVTHSVQQGGLGFDLKWNMGWMNDTLRYFCKDSFYRHYHQQDLTFGLLYAFTEKFILVLSHDEVVHGKGNLLSKMPGDLWQKFANLRLLLSYLVCQPGKKLLFMGGEIGQWNEWNCKGEIEWGLLSYGKHQGVQRMVKELNQLYLASPSLWERDFDYTGFEWVSFSDVQNSVISYLRIASHQKYLCVHNFTPVYLPEYYLALKGYRELQELFNSDHESYGGSGKLNSAPKIVFGQDGLSEAVNFCLAPLATMIFRIL
jgi:1,4-alpha-glucan branching enzyme